MAKSKKKSAAGSSAEATAEPGIGVARFDPAGGVISARVSCGFAQPGAYTLFLWEANKNKIVMERPGNFLNSDDDEYPLPTPNSVNQGRYVQALVTVAITPPELHYAVAVTVLQDGNNLATELRSGSGEPGDAITRTLWIRLEAK
jgi:hypothetical protein